MSRRSRALPRQQHRRNVPGGCAPTHSWIRPVLRASTSTRTVSETGSGSKSHSPPPRRCCRSTACRQGSAGPSCRRRNICQHNTHLISRLEPAPLWSVASCWPISSHPSDLLILTLPCAGRCGVMLTCPFGVDLRCERVVSAHRSSAVRVAASTLDSRALMKCQTRILRHGHWRNLPATSWGGPPILIPRPTARTSRSPA
jgi:hypothetical protein